VSPRRALLAAAALIPAAAAGLEPRFDHREMHGPVVETLAARDTFSSSRRGSTSSWRPAIRAGWGFDPTGDGNELVFAGDVALRSLSDPERERVLVAASARYRSYFGTEELKTFFEFGAHVPIRSRLAAGPLIGVGLAHDFSRRFGIHAAAEFATAFGEVRIFTLALLAGAQIRFELP
jgi:hypothetical protein